MFVRARDHKGVRPQGGSERAKERECERHTRSVRAKGVWAGKECEIRRGVRAQSVWE